MSRAERRAAAKATKRKPRKQERSTLNPVIRAIIEADFKVKFSELKREAEVHCLASEDITRTVYHAGFLLFVTLRALEIEALVIEDIDVIEALELMGNTLGDLHGTNSITQKQRTDLVTGMDYLDALVQPLSKEAIAIAWHQVDSAALNGGIGTHDLDALLRRLN